MRNPFEIHPVLDRCSCADRASDVEASSLPESDCVPTFPRASNGAGSKRHSATERKEDRRKYRAPETSRALQEYLASDQISGEKIVSVENSDDITACQGKSVIDGIVKSPVRFASNGSSHVMRPCRVSAAPPHNVRGVQSAVLRGAVQYEVLNAYSLRKLLTVHRSARAQNRPFAFLQAVRIVRLGDMRGERSERSSRKRRRLHSELRTPKSAAGRNFSKFHSLVHLREVALLQEDSEATSCSECLWILSDYESYVVYPEISEL